MSTDIVKAPPKKEAMPMQHSGNNLITESEEDVQSFMTHVGSTNTAAVVKANTGHSLMLPHVETEALGVPDGGADSVIGGPVWLVLTPLSGPLVKFANVIGFDAAAAKKTGLPITAGATKAVAASGKVLMLRAKHMICNPTSPHTSLSTHQMRQAGVIVDDAAKHHKKDEFNNGTQAMHFPEKGERLISI